jgi:hypothetical protein
VTDELSGPDTGGLALERIEYGKYCVTRDGPIEKGVDHERLLMTSGFPAELASKCSPRYLGLADSDAELDREEILTLVERPYGTVIRPVQLSGKLHVIAYRAGIRAEIPPKGRVYTAARYLLDASATASPFSLYTALGKFEGVVRNDLQNLQPLVALHLPLADSPMKDIFLPTALKFIMSGHSVQVGSTEDEFFKLADILWHHLPEQIRPLFSAGWNVGRSTIARLCMSCAQGTNAMVPRFERSGDAAFQWGAAHQTLNLGTGEAYAAAKLNMASSSAERILEQLDSPLATDLPALSPARLPMFPDLLDKKTPAEFRRYGDVRLDDQLVPLLQYWLTGGRVEWNKKRPKTLERLLKNDARKDSVIDLLRREYTVPESVQRADAMTFECFQIDESAFNSDEWSRFPRRRLIRALRDRRIPGLLAAWRDIASTGENLDLDQRNLAALKDLFPKTLDAKYADDHVAMAEMATTPVHYHDMLRSHAKEAALAWAQLDDTAKAGTLLRRLSEVLVVAESSLLARELGNLVTGSGYGIPVESPKALSADERNGLAAVMDRLWATQQDSLDSGGLEGLVLWAESLRAGGHKTPTLRLAAGYEVGASELAAIVRGRIHETVPALLEKLVSQALTCLPDLRAIILEDRGPWQFLLGKLTAFHIWILFGYADRPECWSEVPETAPLDLTGAQVANLLGEWYRAVSVPTRNAALVWLCQTCTALPQNTAHPSIVHAIRGVLKGSWDSDFSAEWPDVGDAVGILRSGVTLPEPSKVKVLFLFAKQSWQIRLILEVFPEVQHEHGAYRNKWPLLIRQRAWLRKHLEDTSSAGEVKKLLAPALLDFFDPDAKTPLPVAWQETYEKTDLWAAFGLMPKSQPGVLKSALDVYGANERERTECCRRLLRARSEPVEYERVWKLVMAEFVAPVLRHLRGDILDAFFKWWQQGRVAKLPKARMISSCEIRLDRGDDAQLAYQDGDLLVPDGFVLLMQELTVHYDRTTVVEETRRLLCD